jgi:hypothetical protein
MLMKNYFITKKLHNSSRQFHKTFFGIIYVTPGALPNVVTQVTPPRG